MSKNRTIFPFEQLAHCSSIHIWVLSIDRGNWAIILFLQKKKKNHTSALILKTTKITGWLTASAYDLCMRKLLSAAVCAHQSRSRDPCVVGRISRKLWRGHLHLCWPAASHKKYFSSRWLYAELSGLQENESYLNMSTALLEKKYWNTDIVTRLKEFK